MSGPRETPNKHKILNDPVYGFISLPHELIHDLIEHPFFQRLRRIKQLGLTHLVYPGALHTRFHHALGAMHLMQEAINVLRSKGHRIGEDEAQGALVAILLHDIGHGPFSHALEKALVRDVDHEDISSMVMDRLNEAFGGRLETGIRIFRNEHEEAFLHALVSSQLDMDRLDYLKRDSFYSGVSEGIVSSDRIIKMLDVHNDELVVEEKGIYSVEKFIVARRLMYWQVYLHKTVVSAEHMLLQALKRARDLAEEGVELFATPPLHRFLYERFDRERFDQDPKALDNFMKLDDADIMSSIKVWCKHEDPVLADICERLTDRRLFRIELQERAFSDAYVESIRDRVRDRLQVPEEAIDHYVIQDSTSNHAYVPGRETINMLMNDGSHMDLAKASDNLNISALSHPVEKFFLCYPKEC
ncbi:MAG: HD domain-containing protein [Flavobacteriales bacterium]